MNTQKENGWLAFQVKQDGVMAIVANGELIRIRLSHKNHTDPATGAKYWTTLVAVKAPRHMKIVRDEAMINTEVSHARGKEEV